MLAAVKIVRLFKLVSFLRPILKITRSLTNIKKFIQKIMIIFPIGMCIHFYFNILYSVISGLVFKLISILIAVLYVYAVIAMEVFNDSKATTASSDYIEDSNRYANFNTFGFSLLLLFQVVSETG